MTDAGLKSKDEKAFDFAVQHLRFEIDLFRQRSLVFWGIISAAFVGYGVMIKEPNNEVLALAVSCFGFVCSVAWTLNNRASRYWRIAWEAKLNTVEHAVLGRPIYSKLEPNTDRGFWGAWSYSVERLAIALSDFVILVWIVLALNASPLSPKSTSNWLSLLMVSGTAIYALAILFGARRRLRPQLPVTCRAEEPLRIAKQGSMEAGGRTIYCSTNDGGDPNSSRFPSGRVVVDNIYATYQYPADRRYPYSILFNSGGGHTARVYDTTPDGREGWLTLFVREGFAVYGVDRPNTGRSGTDICKINAVKLGKAPPNDLPAINRYPAESSWISFRWGPKFGEPYPNTQFPIEFADNYYPQTVSTYRDPEETRKSVSALTALIDKINEPVIIQSWSSSGLVGYLTAVERPQCVKAILAVETSVADFDLIPAEARQKVAKIPIYIVIGDHAQDRVDASRKFQKEMASIGGSVTVDVLPEAGIFGNGHTMMLEKNNKQIMHRMIAWLEGSAFEAR